MWFSKGLKIQFHWKVVIPGTLLKLLFNYTVLVDYKL